MFGVPKIVSDEARIDEFLARGVAEVIPSKESLKKLLMSGKRLTVKLGIDPTSPNIHLGRSVPLLTLKALQELGHRVVFIAGDFTAMIGDTSDKESERPMLSREVIEQNLKTYKKQVGTILDLGKVEFRRNSEWLEKLTYREIGEHADVFSVADFIARENIARRLSGGKRVSLREVLYPLMQGYDSVAIKADLEIGGTDQRFNLLAGRALQEHAGQPPQHILMLSLVTDPSGAKMSSSWGNTINISDAPADMFGKTMAIPDGLVEGYFTSMTRKPMEEVGATLALHPRDAKLALAEELVRMYHGKEAAESARENFVKVFSEKEAPETMPTITVSAGTLYIEGMVASGVVASKTEARRLLADGAVSSIKSGLTITDHHAKIEGPDTLRIGKKKFLEIKIG